MGIDGIGKPPPIGPASGTEGPGAPSADFRLPGAEAAAPSGDLARLERGEMGLDAYLDARVGAATQHLVGRVSPEQLEFVRQTLRGELSSDPVLIELVRRATGQTVESR
ncbi:MAG TPA: hypothetical protein VGQ57_06770 [Polyangiaceae bacterium]|jgi:hypothetical protein|nr:hypothetical protein [Polyangiaceae bacterium]